MIIDGKKYHYLSVKKLSALLRGIRSNHNRDFCCLNCFHSYRTKEKLKKHKKVYNNNDFCYVKMPNNNYEKILKYNPGEKPLNVPFLFMLTWSVCLKKWTHVKTILKNLLQKKKLCIRLQVTHGLHAVDLINQKPNGVITKEKTV